MEQQRLEAREAANYLGVCKDTLYTMARRGEIPHYRLRRRVMFTKESIDQWIKDQEAESVKP